MSGGRARSLCSLFHLSPLPLFSLLQMTAMPSAGLLAGARPSDTFRGKNAHLIFWIFSFFFCAHTKLQMHRLAGTRLRSNIRMKLRALAQAALHMGEMRKAATCQIKHSLCSILLAASPENTFFFFIPSGVKPARSTLPAKPGTRM